MKFIESNIKSNCCQKKLPISPALTRCIRLFDKISDTCLQNLNFKRYDLNKILILNDNQERPKGIVSHTCTNNKRLVSMIIDIYQNTCFCIAGKIELR